MRTTEENNYLRQYAHQHIPEETERRMDAYVADMEKEPEKADEISKKAIEFIKENISDLFCQTVGFLYVLNERCCIDLPILEDIVNDCYKNISGIKNKMFHDLLETKIDEILTGYDPFSWEGNRK